MGQITNPAPPGALFTDLDRLTTPTGAAGMTPTSAHVIALGQNAATNLDNDNIIALGFNAFAGGNTDRGDHEGSIAIGKSAAGVLGSRGTLAAAGVAVVAIGRDAMGLALRGGSAVVIGDRACALAAAGAAEDTIADSVYIGPRVASRVVISAGRCLRRNVIIGSNAGQPLAGGETVRDMLDAVFIGADAGLDYSANGANGWNGAVVIGARAGSTNGASNPSDDCIFIGRDAGIGRGNTGSIAIGAASIAGSNTAAGGSASIAIGRSCQTTAGQAIAIGDSANGGNSASGILIGGASSGSGDNSIYIGGAAHVLTGLRNITLGHASGNGEAAANNDRFIVETFVAATRRAIIYANMAEGNAIIGNSIPGTNRDFRGTTNPTNALKLLNGTAGTGANTTGGGYFYVAAGALHWVGSAGTDTAVAPA